MQTRNKYKIVAKIDEKLQDFHIKGNLIRTIYIAEKIRTIVRIFGDFPTIYGKLFIVIKRNGGL